MEPSEPTSLLALSREQLRERVEALGGKAFHARILRENVVAKGLLDYEQMSSLPKSLREALARTLPIFSGGELARKTARDGTTKLLIGFARGGVPRAAQNGVPLAQTYSQASVETVHMPSLYLDEEGEPQGGATLCVSTQVGCPIGCPFCASGQLGLMRNLAAHEILEQYIRGRALGALARSVVMGMGEPLLNQANLLSALDAVHDEMGIGARKITVSTVGQPERLRQLAPKKPRFQLAISLHTPDQEQRDELVPAMKGVPIEEVLAAGDDWFEKTGREVTYEYVLLGGTNDSGGHAQRLLQRLRSRRAVVNLIPYNPVEEGPYRRPEKPEVERFRQTLLDGGLVATVRWSRGLEGDAACGQLRLRKSVGSVQRESVQRESVQRESVQGEPAQGETMQGEQRRV
jgi:23S rRNA (adenine2503-C2)-methyltransferase